MARHPDTAQFLGDPSTVKPEVSRNTNATHSSFCCTLTNMAGMATTTSKIFILSLLTLYCACAGRSVSKDDETALQRLRTSAEQGDANAQYELGSMYRDGEGVPKDSAQALQWYSKAAEGGDIRAQSDLGTMYYTAIVVARAIGGNNDEKSNP